MKNSREFIRQSLRSAVDESFEAFTEDTGEGIRSFLHEELDEVFIDSRREAWGAMRSLKDWRSERIAPVKCCF